MISILFQDCSQYFVLFIHRRWDNMKTTVKKKRSEEKRYAMGTGGGPEQRTTVDEIDKQVEEIASHMFVEVRLLLTVK